MAIESTSTQASEEQVAAEPKAKEEMSPAKKNLIRLLAEIAVDKYLSELRGVTPPFKATEKS